MIFGKLLLTIVLWAKCDFVHSQWCDNGQHSHPYALYGYTSNGHQAYENDVYFQSAYPYSYSQPVMYDYTQMYSPYPSTPQPIVVIVTEDGLDLDNLLGIPAVCDTCPICIPYPGSVPVCGCDFETKSCCCKSKCGCKHTECCPCCDCVACGNCQGDCGCNKKKHCSKKSKCSDHSGCCDCRQQSDCCISDRGCKHKKIC